MTNKKMIADIVCALDDQTHAIVQRKMIGCVLVLTPMECRAVVAAHADMTLSHAMRFALCSVPEAHRSDLFDHIANTHSRVLQASRERTLEEMRAWDGLKDLITSMARGAGPVRGGG